METWPIATCYLILSLGCFGEESGPNSFTIILLTCVDLGGYQLLKMYKGRSPQICTVSYSVTSKMCFWSLKAGAKCLKLWLVFVKTITKNVSGHLPGFLFQEEESQKKTACQTVRPYWKITVWDFSNIKKRWNSSKIFVQRCFSTQRMFMIIPKCGEALCHTAWYWTFVHFFMVQNRFFICNFCTADRILTYRLPKLKCLYWLLVSV